MALPKIGLRAVLELAAFQRDVRRYERMLSDMQKQTQTTATGITAAGSGMTKSFADFTRQSDIMSNSVYGTIGTFADLYEVWKELYAEGGVIAQCEFGLEAKPENVYTVFETWDSISQSREKTKR